MPEAGAIKRTAYLDDSNVRCFLAWADPLASGERLIRHRWDSPKWGQWECETLFGAYRTYCWRVTTVLPGDSTPRRGCSYQDTVDVLDDLKQQLRQGKENNPVRFVEAARAVARWGQVRSSALSEESLTMLAETAALLDPAEADLNRLSGVRLMNASLSEIYSLLLDDFPIYDSRVACALASLVCLWSEESGRTEVPKLLRLRLPPSRGTKSRNPSRGPHVFPRIGNPRRYAESNVMAAWLLDALAEKPRFSELGRDGLRAIQSAMFMIGYTVYSPA